MEILALLFATYLMSLGFGVIMGGQRGISRVHRWWFRAITGTIGWILEQIGNGLKALGKKVRH